MNAIDQYISSFPIDTQQYLQEIRAVISKYAPNAIETINYGMPTFQLNGNLVHFAGFKNHVGFYPSPSAIEKFVTELKAYRTSKGAIQFPLGKALPLTLIEEIVKFRVKQNLKLL